MKYNIFILFRYLYYLSLIILLILYLFPGSLIGYLLYGELGKQPNLISNPIGTSINHLIYFIWLSTSALALRAKHINLFNNIYLIFLFSVILELSHFIIPNRAFEYNDLFANMLGVLIGLTVYKIFKWTKF